MSDKRDEHRDARGSAREQGSDRAGSRPGFRRRNAPELATPRGFVHVVDASARRIIHVSGQVSYDGQGQIVGRGDLGVQTRQVLQNVMHALAAAGAAPADIVKLTWFVVNLDAGKAATIREARAAFLAPDALPASTMVGVTSLNHPDCLLELEAVAMRDD